MQALAAAAKTHSCLRSRDRSWQSAWELTVWLCNAAADDWTAYKSGAALERLLAALETLRVNCSGVWPRLTNFDLAKLRGRGVSKLVQSAAQDVSVVREAQPGLWPRVLAQLHAALTSGEKIGVGDTRKLLELLSAPASGTHAEDEQAARDSCVEALLQRIAEQPGGSRAGRIATVCRTAAALERRLQQGVIDALAQVAAQKAARLDLTDTLAVVLAFAKLGVSQDGKANCSITTQLVSFVARKRHQPVDVVKQLWAEVSDSAAAPRLEAAAHQGRRCVGAGVRRTAEDAHACAKGRARATL